VVAMNSTELLTLCSCFSSRMISRAVTPLYEHYVAGEGITIVQFSILVMLDNESGASISEMSDTLTMERTTLLRTIKPLLKDGLINIDTSPRQHIYAISLTGREKLARAMPLWQRAQDSFVELLGEDDANHLQRISRKLRELYL